MEDLQAATTVPDMVERVKEAIYCLGSFNLNLRALYDQVHNLFLFRREFLHVKAAFQELAFGEEASPEFQAITGQMDQLQYLSYRVIKDFSDTSVQVNNLRTTSQHGQAPIDVAL